MCGLGVFFIFNPFDGDEIILFLRQVLTLVEAHGDGLVVNVLIPTGVVILRVSHGVFRQVSGNLEYWVPAKGVLITEKVYSLV